MGFSLFNGTLPTTLPTSVYQSKHLQPSIYFLKHLKRPAPLDPNHQASSKFQAAGAEYVNALLPISRRRLRQIAKVRNTFTYIWSKNCLINKDMPVIKSTDGLCRPTNPSIQGAMVSDGFITFVGDNYVTYNHQNEETHFRFLTAVSLQLFLHRWMCWIHIYIVSITLPFCFSIPLGCLDNHRATISTHGWYRKGNGGQLALSPSHIDLLINVKLHTLKRHFHCHTLIYPLLLWAGWSVASCPSHLNNNRRTRQGRALIWFERPWILTECFWKPLHAVECKSLFIYILTQDAWKWWTSAWTKWRLGFTFSLS